MNDSKEDDTADIDSNSDTSIGTDVPDGAEDGDGTDSTDDNFDDHIHYVNIRMFTQPTGPRHSLLFNASEVTYFLLLVTVHLILYIVNETNRCAAQCQAARGFPDQGWHDTNLNEMEVYIVLNIIN